MPTKQTMKLSDIKEVKVAGFTVQIEDRSDQLLYLQQHAMFNAGDMVIAYRSDDSEQMQAQSILHELLHAIEVTYLEGEAISERVISGFAQGIYQVMRDNKEVVDAIIGA